MADFSAGEAFASGFRLIARRPVAVLAWVATYILIGILPILLILSLVAPQMVALYQDLGRQAVEHTRPDPLALSALAGRINGVQPLFLLVALITRTILMGAIFRAVLEPEDDRFFYLRLGAREAWLGLVIAVLYVAFVIGALVVGLIVGMASVVSLLATGVATRGNSAVPATVMWVTVFVLLGFIPLLWSLCRLSLALPMTFAQRRFLVWESWDFTRGRGWKIFFLYVGLVLLLFIVELLFVAVIAAAGLGLAAAGAFSTWVNASPEAVIHGLLPWIPVWILGAGALGALVDTLLMAPLAEIYRQLTGGGTA